MLFGQTLFHRCHICDPFFLLHENSEYAVSNQRERGKLFYIDRIYNLVDQNLLDYHEFEYAFSNVDFDGKFFHTRHIWVVLPSSFSSFWLSFWSLDPFPQYMRRTQTFFSSCTFSILRVPFSIKFPEFKKTGKNAKFASQANPKWPLDSILVIALHLSTELQTTPVYVPSHRVGEGEWGNDCLLFCYAFCYNNKSQLASWERLRENVVAKSKTSSFPHSP